MKHRTQIQAEWEEEMENESGSDAFPVELTCWSCAGSGEGRFPDMQCVCCHGEGTIRRPTEEDENDLYESTFD